MPMDRDEDDTRKPFVVRQRKINLSAMGPRQHREFAVHQLDEVLVNDCGHGYFTPLMCVQESRRWDIVVVVIQRACCEQRETLS